MTGFRLQIDLCLLKPRAEESIWMRHIRIIPFVPRNGDSIRLTSDDEESTLDLQLEEIIYDAGNGLFLCEISIDTMIENYSETGACKETEVVNEYKRFDFQRLTFPTATAVKLGR